MLRIALILTLLCSSGWAQEGSEAVTTDPEREAVFIQRAKKRQYPGGRDEEDLKVQSQVVSPQRKLAPQAEIREEPEDE
jgi:hypothetical protein